MSKKEQEPPKSSSSNHDVPALRAKLVTIDGAQAILLPDECRFPEGTEFEIKKSGDFLIVSPVDAPPWSAFRKSLELFSDRDPLERDQPDYTGKREQMD